MAKKHFVIRRERQDNRAYICSFIMEHGVDGWNVDITEPKKKREQEEKYHAMISDIAKQVEHIGRKWDPDDMKRLLVDEFADEMRLAGMPLHHDGRVAPSFDGRRIVQLGMQTRDFYVKEASQFIEFLYAFGEQRDVKWSEPSGRKEDEPTR